MSESVKTLSLGISQGESPANKGKADASEDEPREPKRRKISPRATLDALSGLRIGRERVMIPESLDAKARGASASVQIAILLPPNEEHPRHSSTQGHFVALKQFRLDDDKGDKAGLAPLAHELSLLRKLEHKNIVRGLGFVENVAQGIAWIVIPWAVNGHLRDFVRSRLSSWVRGSGIWSGIKDRFALIEDIVHGLEYLHGQSEPICHGDLKSLNILVDEQQNAVITDFGSARTLEKREGWEAPSETAKPSCSTTSQPPEGPRVEFLESTGSITMTASGYTVRWAAPEVLDGELPTLASDIWSLGWIIWEVLTGEFPFNDILKDHDVIIEVLGGKVPELHESVARSTDPEFSALSRSVVRSTCTLMERCWAMAPHSRPKCCDLVHVHRLGDYWSRTREYIEKDLKAVDEAVLLQAVSERHLSEGRLGEALQYIQAFRRAVRLTEGEPAAITFQDMLDRCRRSPSTVDTVPEEEAARSWNSALDLFAGQLYLEAERHIIDAALLYKVLGFDTQVLECVQFLDVLQAATATPSQNPTEEARYNQDLPKRLLMRSEELKDPKYENRENPAEMVWFVAGALQHASPTPLTARRIVSLIEKYHPGKIRQCRESSSGSGKGCDTEFIECILSGSEAFEADERSSRYWRLVRLACLPPFPRKTVNLLNGYFTPLGSPRNL